MAVASQSASALDDSRLWLPKSQQSLYLSLVKAALAAESIDRCVEVLEATVDMQRSRPEHPIFRILCRQENKMSYNEMVDGLTFDTLTTIPLTAEQLAAIEEKKVRDYWQQCKSPIEQKVALMDQIKWLTERPPEPSDVTEEGASFVLQFDSKDIQGQDLHFQVVCQVDSEQGAEVTLSGRSR